MSDISAEMTSSIAEAAPKSAVEQRKARKHNRNQSKRPVNVESKAKPTNQQKKPQSDNKPEPRRDHARSSVQPRVPTSQNTQYFKNEEFGEQIEVYIPLNIVTDDIKDWLNTKFERFGLMFMYGFGGLVRAGVGAQCPKYERYVDRFLGNAEVIIDENLAITQKIVDDYLKQYDSPTLTRGATKKKIQFHNSFHLRYLKILEKIDRLLCHYSFLHAVGHINSQNRLTLHRMWASLPKRLDKKLMQINTGIEEQFNCRINGRNRTPNLSLPGVEVGNYIENFEKRFSSVTNRQFELHTVTTAPDKIDTSVFSKLSFQYAKKREEGNKLESIGEGPKSQLKTESHQTTKKMTQRLKEI
jgi:hypothetical protein